ncbi:hypothetical protein GCM10023192_26810 [Amycolatopsis samaneae]
MGISAIMGISDSRAMERVEEIGTMNSSPVNTEPDIESALIDLGAVPFTALRELDEETLRFSTNHVVERTRNLSARYRSSNAAGGERID